MSVDAYTNQPMTAPSEEHIVANALGGRWTAPVLDRSTNSERGRTIDAALARTVNPIRVFLNAKSGDGQSPARLTGAVAAAGDRCNILPGGIPELGNARAEFSMHGDQIHVVGRARSHGELRGLLKRKAAAHKIPLEQLEAASRSVEEHVGELQIQFALDTEGRRAIAKMTGNLLAASAPDLLAQPGFEPFREFVLRGGDARDFVTVSVKRVDLGVEHRKFGPLDHLVTVRGFRSSEPVEAFVVLFGHLQFCVRLGLGEFSRPLAYSYRVDRQSAPRSRIG